jgi:hypothetical protein
LPGNCGVLRGVFHKHYEVDHDVTNATQKPLRKAHEDHDFDLSDSFSRGPRKITQTAYFRAGDIVVAIGELNKPNHWNDAAFERAIAFLQRSWNDAVKAEKAIARAQVRP